MPQFSDSVHEQQSRGYGRGIVSRMRAIVDRPLPSGARLPRVAIIGSGFGGVNMAIRLKQLGVESFTIYERSNSLGGTWRDNSYPGAACDVPSHLYSYSFEPKADWTSRYSPQPEILEYLEGCVDRYGVRSHIRFGVEIAAADWDDDQAVWRLRTAAGEAIEADVVVAATGQLNEPSYPDIPGREMFSGTAFHSARWDHEHDLSGRDVAVIGTGASAIQFVPEVAKVARSVTVFQRHAPYVAPKPEGDFTATEIRRFERIPGWERLYRWRIYWAHELRFGLFLRNSPLGRRVGRLLGDGLRRHVVSDDLPESALIPDYPVGCNRLLISNDWYPTLMSDHVRVVTEPIDHIDEREVVTADGHAYEVDTIVYGTGFRATNFVGGLPITGRDGQKLSDAWNEGAQAYLGMTVSGFPNFFMLYGPNTNLGHNSIVFMLERQVEYILQCLRRMAVDRIDAIDVKADAMARNTDKIQARLMRTVWAEQCNSWYKTATGRITNNWSGPTVEYWWATKRVHLDDYQVVRPRVDARPAPITAD